MKTLSLLLALVSFTSHGQTFLDALRPGAQVNAFKVHQMTYKGQLIQGQGIAPLAQVVPIKVTFTPQGNYDNHYLINAIKYA